MTALIQLVFDVFDVIKWTFIDNIFFIKLRKISSIGKCPLDCIVGTEDHMYRWQRY